MRTVAGSYELGVKFTSSEAGEVTGVRFYKQTWMGGYTHVGHLWSSTGTLLATATFTNETSSGWQQVSFSSPVAIQANTVYIVSFSSGGGYFGISTGFFNNGGVSNGPLQALSNSTSGGDGVYNTAGDFPDVSGSGMNFWVDVAFAPSAGTSVQIDVSAHDGATSTSGPIGAGLTAGQSGYFVVAVHDARAGGTVELRGRLARHDGPGRGRRRPSAWLRGPISATSRSRGTPIRWGWKGSSLLGSIDG